MSPVVLNAVQERGTGYTPDRRASAMCSEGAHFQGAAGRLGWFNSSSSASDEPKNGAGGFFTRKVVGALDETAPAYWQQSPRRGEANVAARVKRRVVRWRGHAVVMDAGPRFADGHFDRDDQRPDTDFYRSPRLVTHIDDAAIAAVGNLYAELGIAGADGQPRRVLDLMSSWVSHLHQAPSELVVLGLNAAELAANAMASERVVHDLNADPALPFCDASFDAVLCCVSIDYLITPVEVLAEAARVLRPGAPIVITFSNRCFPTKAVHGWLDADDTGRCAIVVDYLHRAGGFTPASASLRTPAVNYRGDPLYAVTAYRAAGT